MKTRSPASNFLKGRNFAASARLTLSEFSVWMWANLASRRTWASLLNVLSCNSALMSGRLFGSSERFTVLPVGVLPA